MKKPISKTGAKIGAKAGAKAPVKATSNLKAPAKSVPKAPAASAKPGMGARFWMVKQEPEDYPFSQLVADKTTNWTGVRNFQARNFLQEMKVGDSVFYYHSVSEKAVVGLAKVEKAAFPDPTQDAGESWVCVTLKADHAFKKTVSLAEIRATPGLAGLPLIRQSRLSVMPVPSEMAALLLKMAGAK
jgi:predicted RNA-binding protein with PUA-like domain